MSNGSGDIIIKGDASVEIDFDGGVYEGAGGKHKNTHMKLTKIIITNEAGGIEYESDKDPKKWTIKAVAKK